MKRFRLEDYTLSDLPLMVWRLSQPGRQEPHRHDCIEMVYVVSGAGIMEVNGCRYPIVRGDLYVMNPGDIHAFVGDEQFNFYNIMFREDLFTAAEQTTLRRFPAFAAWLERRPDHRPAGRKKYNFAPPLGDELETRLERLERELKSRRPDSLMMARALFDTLLLDMLRHVSANTADRTLVDDRSGGGIPRVISWIYHHYRERLTIAQLARIGGVSRNYLGELFRRETGLTPFDYVCRLRAEKARQMLEESPLSISEIAAELGFCDTSYFSRSFRRFTGLSPRQYRRMLQAR